MNKILCVCEAGVVRSGAMAFMLKYEFHQDAIAASHARTSDETMLMLSNWADLIIPMGEEFIKRIPMQNLHKVHVVPIGPDRWRNPLNQELLDIVGKHAQELRNNDWRPRR